ncbi:MAG: hypothetical protein EVA59_00745 [Limnobacter sp.]|nr:MAG: hypothetical protein EVA59_00745 [Limnobacter sp.]
MLRRSKCSHPAFLFGQQRCHAPFACPLPPTQKILQVVAVTCPQKPLARDYPLAVLRRLLQDRSESRLNLRVTL